MSLWPPRREDQAKLDRSLAGASPLGRSGRQTKRGASGSELLLARKHVPDRVGEPPRDVDLGDLGPALFVELALEVVDQLDRRSHVAPPGLRHVELRKQPATLNPE